MNRNRAVRVHIWLPDLLEGGGGIRAFSYNLLVGFAEVFPDADYTVVVKNDRGVSGEKPSIPNLKLYSMGRWPRLIRTAAFLGRLAVCSVFGGPELIVCGHLNFSPAAYWFNRLFGLRYWLIAHGVESWGVTRRSVRRAISGADRILAVSEYTRSRLLDEHSLPADRVVILPDTLRAAPTLCEEKAAYLRNRYSLEQSDRVILTVGRLSAEEGYKGYDKVIRALTQVRSAVSKVKYIIVGAGDDEPRIRRLVSDLGLNDCVILAGYVPDEELWDHYNLCDVFAMPSKGEGFGIVFLEALACGKPVLAGNKDGSSEPLCQGELGALVDPDDVREIARTLIAILNGSYPNRMIYDAAALRESALGRFGFESFKKILSRYVSQFFQEAEEIPLASRTAERFR